MASQHSMDDSIYVDTGSLALQILDQDQESLELDVDDSSIDPALFASSNTPSKATSQPADIFNTPDTATQSKARRGVLKWTPAMHETLLVTLLDQCRAGKRADSGFKKEAWVAVLTAVQGVYSGTIKIEEKQVKSRLDWVKGLWKEWLALEEIKALVGMNLLSFLQLKIVYGESI